MAQLRFFLLTLFVCCLLLPLIALAQASQPASAPVAVSWLRLYWPYILAALVVIVPAVITICRRHPESQGATRAATFLEIFMEFITIVCPRGSKKMLKMPFTRAKPPTK